MRERIQEEIQRGTILIDTQGAAVGQVNGLSVLSMGQFAFGRPSRITARVRLGRVRSSTSSARWRWGDPIHSKGVLILSAYLGARYASDRPLSLSASLVFEQSYSGVEGDGASSAELYALLSALNLPVKQGLAVTGSVNQRGQVQAIGGVNEKIEGFFDTCRAQGLTESRGADPGFERQAPDAAPRRRGLCRRRTIPGLCRGNDRSGHRALDRNTGGERDNAGAFPAGSVNQRVEARLVELAEKRLAFGVSERGVRG